MPPPGPDLPHMARLRALAPRALVHWLPAAAATPALSCLRGDLQLFDSAGLWPGPYLPPLDCHLLVLALGASGGGARFQVGAGPNQRPLQPGEVLLLPAGEPAYLHLAAGELLLCALRPRQLYNAEAGRAAAAPLNLRGGLLDDVAHGIAVNLRACARGQRPGPNAVAEHLARALVAHLVALHAHGAAPLRDSLGQLRLARARAFLDSRLSSPVDLAEAAEVAGCSVHHFAHLFKASMGISPMRYLRQQRMQFARELVETTQLSMCEIADRVGIPDAARFSQAFRSYWQAAPSAWRRNA